ncbi:MAG: Transcriptional regulator, LysR family [Myxococcales bacterium]|nr:Transcriptional regulator, LysR family [Myxococcales bacterium]
METTLNLELVAQFVAVAETMSFSTAARKLGVTKGTVSRAIARLEGLLGTELVHRTTRQVALSTAGLALYERAVTPLAALRQAVATLPEAGERPFGMLRLTAPVALGSHPLGEIVARFATRFPEVRLDVHVTNRAVDLVGEGFDLALRVHVAPPKDSSLVARRLGHSELRFYASPAYVARRGSPRVLGDPAHVWIWSRMLDPRRLGIKAPFAPRILTDDAHFVREATRAGAGIGAMPPYLAETALAAGELVRILGGSRVAGAGIYLVYPSGKNVPRKVTAFRDVVLEWLHAHPLT